MMCYLFISLRPDGLRGIDGRKPPSVVFIEMKETPMALQGGVQQQTWEGRSHGQLQEIVQRGLAGGDEFVAAVREMERRAREHARNQELETIETARLRRKRRLVILAVAAAVCFIAVFAELWMANG